VGELPSNNGGHSKPPEHLKPSPHSSKNGQKLSLPLRKFFENWEINTLILFGALILPKSSNGGGSTS